MALQPTRQQNIIGGVVGGAIGYSARGVPSAVAGLAVGGGMVSQALASASSSLFEYSTFTEEQKQQIQPLVHRFLLFFEGELMKVQGIRLDVEFPIDDAYVRNVRHLARGNVETAREAVANFLIQMNQAGVAFDPQGQAVRNIARVLAQNAGSRFRIQMLERIKGFKVPASGAVVAGILQTLKQAEIIDEDGYVYAVLQNAPTAVAVFSGTLVGLNALQWVNDAINNQLFQVYGITRQLRTANMDLRGREYITYELKTLALTPAFRNFILGGVIAYSGVTEVIMGKLWNIATGYSDIASEVVFSEVVKSKTEVVVNKTKEAYEVKKAEKKKEYEKNHKPIGQDPAPAFSPTTPPPPFQAPVEKTESYSFQDKSWFTAPVDYSNYQNTNWNKLFTPIEPLYNVTGDNTPPVAANHGQGNINVFTGSIPQMGNLGPIVGNMGTDAGTTPIVTPVMPGVSAPPLVQAMQSAPIGTTSGDESVDKLAGTITNEQWKELTTQTGEIKTGVNTVMKDRNIKFNKNTHKITSMPTLTEQQKGAIGREIADAIKKLHKTYTIIKGIDKVTKGDKRLPKKTVSGKRSELPKLINGYNRLHEAITGAKYFSEDMKDQAPQQSAEPFPGAEAGAGSASTSTADTATGETPDIDPGTIPEVDPDTVANEGIDFARGIILNELDRNSPFIRSLMLMSIKKAAKKLKKTKSIRNDRYNGLKVNQQYQYAISNSFSEYLPMR